MKYSRAHRILMYQQFVLQPHEALQIISKSRSHQLGFKMAKNRAEMHKRLKREMKWSLQAFIFLKMYDPPEESPLTLSKRLQKDLNHKSCQVQKYIYIKVHQSSFHIRNDLT